MGSATPRPAKPPRMPMSSTFTQMYPPKPAFVEKDVPDLSGKVYIVTGSNTGIGKEVAQILYAKNAKVYIAARSEDRAKKAITEIKSKWPKSNGKLVFLQLDLADLATVKGTVEKLTSQESQLHVVFNNAGVQALKNTDGSIKTAQGHELHLGVNVLGVFLFTRLLTPILVATAKSNPPPPPNTVRVVWVSSMATEMIGEKSHGLSLDYLKYWPSVSPLERYGLTKAGNWVQSVEYARRYQADGVLSIACNPGHLQTDLYREGGRIFNAVLGAVVLFPPINGAYTEIFAGFSPTITMKESGQWVVPWGRLHPIRKDLQDATKTESEGGNGHAKKFWEWSEEQVRDFL